LGLLLVLVVVAIVLYLLLSGGSSRPSAKAGSGTGTTTTRTTTTGTTTTGIPVTGTVTVRRRDLEVTSTVEGRLVYAHPTTVLDYLSGRITALAPVGQVVEAGQMLFSIDHTPVVLLSGSAAASRALTPADSPGPDIYELNANLVALGYGGDPIVVNDIWQPATTLGVERLQAHLGEAQTGELPLGYAVFLPGPQIVEAQDAAVGGYAAAASAPEPGSAPGTTTVVGSDYQVTSGSDGRGGSAQPPPTYVSYPSAGPRYVGDASTGQTQGIPVLSTASAKLLVSAELPRRLSSGAKVGQPATVTLPDGSVRPGKISAVGTVTTGSTIPVTITLSTSLAKTALDHAVVHIRLATRETRDALSVPTSALTRGAGGGPALRAARSGKLLPVRTGIIAGGYVAVSGPGIHPGLAVEEFGKRPTG